MTQYLGKPRCTDSEEKAGGALDRKSSYESAAQAAEVNPYYEDDEEVIVVSATRSDANRDSVPAIVEIKDYLLEAKEQAFG